MLVNVIAGAPVEAARGGKYEVLRPLAVGGMAELHLVREHPDRLAVVKQLHRKLSIDPEFVRMFLDEARIGVTLHHPNVVEVYEICEDADQCYIAMEHLHGHDLRRTMARMTSLGSPVAFAQALSIARGVAAGLHYTHERTGDDGELLGIVHRDVSPHNVILTYGGDVKIVDFGIAKATIQMSRTRTGVLKGKVAYMAPEQALGEPLDRRSDVFCVGILLWEMTTGRWLYRRRSELETLNAVVHTTPPRLSRMIPDYPRDLERVIFKALSRSPQGRFATAGELVYALDEVARRHQFTLGSTAVRALMATAFADELAAWQHAQSQGTSLGDHLVAQGASRPIAEINDDDALPSVVSFDPPRRLAARYRWPVLGAVAVAGLVAAWLVIASHRGSTPASPTTAVPGRANPAPAALPTGLAPGPAVTPRPRDDDPAHRARSATSSPAKSPPVAGTRTPPATHPITPVATHPITPAASSTAPVPATAPATVVRPPPRRVPGKPSNADLDKLP